MAEPELTRVVKAFSDPRLGSLAGAILFFLLNLVAFRPGYAAPLNHHLRMISITCS